MPDFLGWRQFLGDKIIMNYGSPGGPGLSGLLVPALHGSRCAVGLWEALSRPTHAACRCEHFLTPLVPGSTGSCRSAPVQGKDRLSFLRREHTGGWPWGPGEAPGPGFRRH